MTERTENHKAHRVATILCAFFEKGTVMKKLIVFIMAIIACLVMCPAVGAGNPTVFPEHIATDRIYNVSNGHVSTYYYEIAAAGTPANNSYVMASAFTNMTTNTTLSTAQCKADFITNYGATGQITLTLPEADPGMMVTILTTNTHNVTITPTNQDQILGSSGKGYGMVNSYESNDSAGDAVTLICVEDDYWAHTGDNRRWHYYQQ